MADYNLIIPDALRALMWPAFIEYCVQETIPQSGTEFDKWALRVLSQSMRQYAHASMDRQFLDTLASL